MTLSTSNGDEPVPPRSQFIDFWERTLVVEELHERVVKALGVCDVVGTGEGGCGR